MTKTRVLTWFAVAGTLAGVGGFAALHLLMADTVNPLREPVSAYALTWPGDLIFLMGALGYAVACAALALRGPAGRRLVAVRAMLAGTAAMFVLVVLFPTDSGEAVSSLAGQIHRYAAGAAFVGMTVIGFAVSRRGSAARRWMVVFSGLSAATLLLTTVNTFLPWLADGGQWRGLPQRILLVIQAAMLLAMAVGQPGPGRIRNETFARFRVARARCAFWRQAAPQYLAGRPVVAARTGPRHTSQR